MCTTRGYILDINGGYGGSGKSSDENIWIDILDKARKEIEEADDDEDVHNVLTFFKEVEGTKTLFVVDRGFRSAEDHIPEHWEFKAPVGKKKVKVPAKSKRGKTKTKEEPQLEASAADANRFVTKLRNIVERINKIALKRWRLLGGTLPWQYLGKLEDLVKIAAAIWNRFHALEDDGDLDMQDFDQLVDRMNHKNEIPALMKKNVRFTSNKFDKMMSSQPDLFAHIEQTQIRKWATGWYPMALSEPYLQQARDAERKLRFMATTNRGAVPKNKLLLQLDGLKSRFRNSKTRKVQLLFTKEEGLYQISDTLCNCDGGKRSTSCAHGICALRYLWEIQNNKPSSKPLRSRKILMEMHTELFENDSDYDSDDYD